MFMKANGKIWELQEAGIMAFLKNKLGFFRIFLITSYIEGIKSVSFTILTDMPVPPLAFGKLSSLAIS